jgi:hypothetical protein
MLERGRHFRQEQLVPRFTSLIESLHQQAPSALPLSATSNGAVPKSLAATASLNTKRTYSSGD